MWGVQPCGFLPGILLPVATEVFQEIGENEKQKLIHCDNSRSSLGNSLYRTHSVIYAQTVVQLFSMQKPTILTVMIRS